MSTQLVTVIIVNFNSWDVLYRCLEKLQNQSLRNFNVLVIDNGSEPGAPDDLAVRYPDITLVQNQSNIGFAAANNQAINRFCNSEWVALLNPDAFPEPDWLRQLVAAAEENPEYSMFASRLLMESNNHIIDGDADAYHISGLVWRTGHGRKKTDTQDEPREVFSPCAAAALYRRSALVSVNGFDEDYFCYVEDVDLGFRLRLLGHRCLLVPGAVVHHIGSVTTGGQHSDFSLYHGHRNLVWTFVKNMPGVLFWILLPAHVLLNLVSIVWFSLRGKGGVIMRAKRDAIKGLPKMWAKRRQIQAQRTVKIKDIWRVLDKRLMPHGY